MPRVGTPAALSFLRSWVEVNEFLGWVSRMAVQLEHEGLQRIVAKGDTLTPEMGAEIQAWVDEKSPGAEGRRRMQFFSQVILTRHVENFEHYLSSLVHAIYLQRPETMRSSEAIEYDKVLVHGSMKALVAALAEQKVHSFAYKSLDDMAAYFKRAFKIELGDAATVALLRDLVEVRNLSVHNRCLVNQRYLDRSKNRSYAVGTQRRIEDEEIGAMIPTLAKTVISLDRQARNKLKIRGVRFPADLKSNW